MYNFYDPAAFPDRSKVSPYGAAPGANVYPGAMYGQPYAPPGPAMPPGGAGMMMPGPTGMPAAMGAVPKAPGMVAGAAAAPVAPPPVPAGMPISPTGAPVPTAEESYIENILRLNLGKIATIYMTFENNTEWNAKVFRGRLEAAGRDHIIISDPATGRRYLLLMVNLDYITFDEELNYFSPPGVPLPR